MGKIELVNRSVDRIEFHGGGQVKARLLEGKAQPTGTGKKVDCDGAVRSCHWTLGA